MKKIIILTLILLGICFTAKAQIPTPNPSNGTTVCVNSTLTYGPATISAGVVYNYAISPVIPFTPVSGGSQIEVTWTTPGVYTITLSDNDACTSDITATITVTSTGVITGPDIIVCQNTGNYPIVTNTPGATFTMGGLPIADIDSDILAPGSYTINATFTDANGCISTGTINVIITPTVPLPFINNN